jgi:hypothetical protein
LLRSSLPGIGLSAAVVAGALAFYNASRDGGNGSSPSAAGNPGTSFTLPPAFAPDGARPPRSSPEERDSGGGRPGVSPVPVPIPVSVPVPLTGPAFGTGVRFTAPAPRAVLERTPLAPRLGPEAPRPERQPAGRGNGLTRRGEQTGKSRRRVAHPGAGPNAPATPPGQAANPSPPGKAANPIPPGKAANPTPPAKAANPTPPAKAANATPPAKAAHPSPPAKAANPPAPAPAPAPKAAKPAPPAKSPKPVAPPPQATPQAPVPPAPPTGECAPAGEGQGKAHGRC